MEAASTSEALADINGVWDALCSGLPPPGHHSRPPALEDGRTGKPWDMHRPSALQQQIFTAPVEIDFEIELKTAIERRTPKNEKIWGCPLCLAQKNKAHGQRYACGAGAGDASTSGSNGETEAATAILLEKHAKLRLAVAADHFNRDYKKGFQFLRVRCSS